MSPESTIQNPSCHNKQKKIASAFQEMLAANFDCCAGAVDGILIWIHKVCDACCIEDVCDAGKCFVAGNTNLA